MAQRELIPGGLAPGGRCPRGTPAATIQRGIKVELEHTSSRRLAREIACDHLTEDPRYYVKLARMEHPAQRRRKRQATRRTSA